MGRVAIIARNKETYIDTLISIWAQNDCAVLIDYNMPVKKAIALLRNSYCNRCYVDYEKYLDMIAGDVSGEICWHRLEEDKRECFNLPNKVFERFRFDSLDAEALVLFSSGTTGANKGVIHTQRTVLENAKAIAHCMELHEDDRFYIMRGLAYSSTIVGEVLVCLLTKTAAVISEPSILMRRHLKRIGVTKSTILVLNPTILQMIVSTLEVDNSYDLHLLRKIYTCGGPVSSTLLQRAKRVLPQASILNMYGLTEAGPRVTMEKKETLSGAVGQTIPGVEIKIVDPLDSNLQCEKGCICVRSKSLMRGYITGEPSFLENGWLKTGDIGYVKNKQLYVIGRYDNVIVYNTHNIFPESIEAFLETFPSIKEALICLKTQQEREQLYCYYTTVNSTRLSQSEIKSIISMCKRELPYYEIPQRMIFVSQIEKTTTGKKKRRRENE